MQSLILKYYLWIKSFHIISIICWMAGLLYLPRLFVYHSMTHNPEPYQTFLVMERKLLFYITNPSGIAAVLSGGAMMYFVTWTGATYQYLKLFMVASLVTCNIYYLVLYKAFVLRQNKHEHVFFRVINEVPSLIMILIVLLAVLKPEF